MMNLNIRDKWDGMNHMDLILDSSDSLGSVYLGNIESARCLPKLVDNDISAVLTVADGTGLNYSCNCNTPPHSVCFHLVLKCLDN